MSRRGNLQSLRPAGAEGARPAGKGMLHGSWFPCCLCLLLVCGIFLPAAGAGSPFLEGGNLAKAAAKAPRKIVVNSLDDAETPPQGAVTLRSALKTIAPGGKVLFHRSLNGGTIRLSLVDSDHAILKGELYAGMTFQGYGERDYGRSALYVAKSVVIDAAKLPDGITIAWDGDSLTPARVLAVYGDLLMTNVSITSGRAVGEPISGGTQSYTLARGGGLAVWGTATLSRCTFSGNRVEGDEQASRDRGAFGGAIYGNRFFLTDCVVSGNSARGFGAAGGGVYSVGGRDLEGQGSVLSRCTISGNRVTGQHAYGGGVFSEGGGPGNMKVLSLENCTIARNLVEDNSAIAESSMMQYYYRGGGVYMTNGSLAAAGCTIVENAVKGPAAVFSGKPNAGGGGVAATIGNAHVVERMEIQGSIIAGNTVNNAGNDLFTGSLVEFYSYGYNRIGKLDFSQILVPIPAWDYLSRKHWPKAGDQDGVELSLVASLEGVARHATITSMGVDEGEKAVLWYPPSGSSVDQIPAGRYDVPYLLKGYVNLDPSGEPGRLLMELLKKLRADYASVLGVDFGVGFGDMSGIPFMPTPSTWPAEAANQPWIQFWRNLDTEIGGRLDAVGLGDDFWEGFTVDSDEAGFSLTTGGGTQRIRSLKSDQLNHHRPYNKRGDIGAIELVR
jgi:hypothetical protein